MDEQQDPTLSTNLIELMEPITPSLDMAKYRRHLATLELQPEQEDQLMRTLWSMMTVFVDQAFGLDPIQATAVIIEKSALRDSEISVQEEDKHNHVQTIFSQVSTEQTAKEKPS